MAKTFLQVATEAMAEVSSVTPQAAQDRLRQDPNVLLIDIRDLADRRTTGMAAGATAVSAGMLPIRADLELPEEWRDTRLQDRSRSIITICDLGLMSAISAKTLKDMGFTDVAFIEGGLQGWKDARLPIRPSDDR